MHSAPKVSSLIKFICPVCCETSTSSRRCKNVNCTQHSRFRTSPIQYLHLSMLEQLKDILTCAKELNLNQQKRPSSNNDVLDDIYDGEKYQNIIKNEKEKHFLTLTMNVDGVQLAKDSNTSLWIFTFAINEIKRSERFKLKNIVIGGIAATLFKPSRSHMLVMMSPIVEELLVLEKGTDFQLKSLSGQECMQLKTFLIASCCDKPAQSLVQGISEPTGAYGCGRCELQGRTYSLYFT